MKFAMTAILLTLAGATSHRTHASTIIYQDNFSRPGSGTALLAGTQPDVVNTGGATWSGTTNVITDGSQASFTGGTAEAFLPFTPTTGQIYTLTVDLNSTGPTNNWAAFGFSPGDNTGNYFHTVNAVGPWMAQVGDRTSGDTFFAGPSTDGSQSVGNSTAGYNTLSIVLNTTAADWTTSFFRGATQVGTTFTYGTAPSPNPTIAYVTFGSFVLGSGLVDNFTLSTNVPEPSSWVLVCLGALALLAIARRRRSA